MLKKAMATAAAAVAVSAGIAAPAMAIGNDSGTESMSGNGASQSFGNSATKGDMSPQLSLVQGSLNKPCIGLPAKLNIQNIVALVNVGVQDIPILSAPQNQQCTENSTQAKGDEPLSHLLDDLSLLAGNGEHNG
ncbi:MULTISPECIES: rodlin [Streptomyces]|uniref:RdlA protein n=1 Tax=Streptomyces venezuelae TaxID=54571 RepID=A0A5P2BEE6_STRVZ|nr:MULTISPECIES: rodlin [Streptomyces]NDZ97934.1 RdlA protein [Streptomyces sp. SID10116]MYY80492.1 RdlA protein [Streptomyces sp. SID335]MYZ15236.1 RdlA protein [Streptomyces sp. SID337]NDZ91747.1 RdlA protein [Streptomyces sp. SID10115]NEB44582.1 RdlA protein [Streptomyces sp. SID339]